MLVAGVGRVMDEYWRCGDMEEETAEEDILLDTNNSNNSNEVIIGQYDILCGREKSVFNNIGNKRFRVSISMNIPIYEAAKTKKQKATIIDHVYNVLQSCGSNNDHHSDSGGYRFLKKEKKTMHATADSGDNNKKEEDDAEYYYVEMNGVEARKKVRYDIDSRYKPQYN